MAARKLRPLWRCPKCGARFVTRNMWHSCGKFTLETLFAKSEPQVLPLFKKFAALVRRCGRVTMIPQKTRVVFMDRVRFAGACPRKDRKCSPRDLRFDSTMAACRLNKSSTSNEWYGACSYQQMYGLQIH